MGKKCFCDTTDFCDTKNSPQKPLALTGFQLQSRIKKHVSQVFVEIISLPLRCTKLVHIKEKSIMMIVTARDFRGEQGKILARAARGEDVVITSRDHGSFRIVPITDCDRVYNDDELNQMIQSALEEYEAGETVSYTAKELREMANL